MSNQVFSNSQNQYPLNVPSISFNNGSLLSTYISDGYSTNITGPFSSGPHLGLQRVVGGTSHFSVSGVTGTATGAAPIVLSQLAPVPSGNVYFPIWVTDSAGGDQLGTLFISSTGQVTIYKGFNSNFTGSGTCGFKTFSVSYCSFT